MNTRPLLAQKRNAIARRIEEDPTTMVVYRRPTTDNGYGKQVPDPDQEPSEHTERVRIAHTSAEDGILSYGGNDVGVVPTTSLFVIAKHTADIQEGDKVERGSRIYRLGAVDEIRAYGELVAKRSALTEVETVEVST